MIKMAKRPHEDLIEFLKETLGDKLRDVVLYDTSGHEILFVRNDADRRFVDDEVQLRGQRVSPPVSGRDPPSRMTADDGKLDCLIGMAETVVVVCFYPTETVEIRVSFERNHDLTLQPFVEECLAIVR